MPCGASASVAWGRLGAQPSVARVSSGRASTIRSNTSPPPVPMSSADVEPANASRARSSYDHGGSSVSTEPSNEERSQPFVGSAKRSRHSASSASRSPME